MLCRLWDSLGDLGFLVLLEILEILDSFLGEFRDVGEL